MTRHWGFEEADDVDDIDEHAKAGGADDTTDLLTGQDADGVVTVAVDDAVEVVSVRLAGGWTDPAVRRVLGAKVVEAIRVATTHAVAKQAGQIDMRVGGLVETRTAPVASKSPEPDERPITKEDATRLLRAVSADLAQFRERLSAISDQVVRVESGGGHVTVSGRHRQVGDVSIDQRWVAQVRASEVESELCDALTEFTARSSLGELSRGPGSSAIDELLALVSDPQAMVRRIRRRPTS